MHATRILSVQESCTNVCRQPRGIIYFAIPPVHSEVSFCPLLISVVIACWIAAIPDCSIPTERSQQYIHFYRISSMWIPDFQRMRPSRRQTRSIGPTETNLYASHAPLLGSECKLVTPASRRTQGTTVLSKWTTGTCVGTQYCTVPQTTSKNQ